MTGMSARVCMVAIALGGLSAIAVAADAPIYGSQLMSDQERSEHRRQMRAAGTPEARERIRLQHHEAMKQRATEKGLSLPEMPPPRGSGSRGAAMGPGRGMGGGMGPGGGTGPDRNP